MRLTRRSTSSSGLAGAAGGAAVSRTDPGIPASLASGELVLRALRVRLRPVHRPVRVLGRRVERVELDLAGARVHDVVPDPGGDDDRPVVLDVVRLVDLLLGAPELDPGAALLDAQELVTVRMRLAPDVLARSEAHHRELRVLACEDDGAERVVVERRLLDVA